VYASKQKPNINIYKFDIICLKIKMIN
jgi:hypothetical protein